MRLNRLKLSKDRIGTVTYRIAQKDFVDFCSICGRDIEKGHRFVQKGKELTHYTCLIRRNGKSQQ